MKFIIDKQDEGIEVLVNYGKITISNLKDGSWIKDDTYTLHIDNLKKDAMYELVLDKNNNYKLRQIQNSMWITSDVFCITNDINDEIIITLFKPCKEIVSDIDFEEIITYKQKDELNNSSKTARKYFGLYKHRKNVNNSEIMLRNAKINKHGLLKEYLKTVFSDGWFFSSALNIKVDLRRHGDMNDLQNAESLLNVAKAANAKVIKYVGKDETVVCLTAQLEQLIREMEIRGLDIYNIKWAAENAIDTADSVADLDNICFASYFDM